MFYVMQENNSTLPSSFQLQLTIAIIMQLLSLGWTLHMYPSKMSCTSEIYVVYMINAKKTILWTYKTMKIYGRIHNTKLLLLQCTAYFFSQISSKPTAFAMSNIVIATSTIVITRSATFRDMKWVVCSCLLPYFMYTTLPQCMYSMSNKPFVQQSMYSNFLDVLPFHEGTHYSTLDWP